MQADPNKHGVHIKAIEGFKGADLYERSRPSYPDDAVDHLVKNLSLSQCSDPSYKIVEIGPGTGSFTKYAMFLCQTFQGFAKSRTVVCVMLSCQLCSLLSSHETSTRQCRTNSSCHFRHPHRHSPLISSFQVLGETRSLRAFLPHEGRVPRCGAQQ